jgi:hypothetical protein
MKLSTENDEEVTKETIKFVKREAVSPRAASDATNAAAPSFCMFPSCRINPVIPSFSSTPSYAHPSPPPRVLILPQPMKTPRKPISFFSSPNNA